MTPAQQVGFFFAAVWLALAIVWIVALSMIFPKPKPQPIRVEKKRRIY